MSLAALLSNGAAFAEVQNSSRFVQKLAPIHPIGEPLGRSLREKVGAASVVVIMRDINLNTWSTYNSTRAMTNYMVLNPWDVGAPPTAGGPYSSSADVDVAAGGSRQANQGAAMQMPPVVTGQVPGMSTGDALALSGAVSGVIGALVDADVRRITAEEWPKVIALNQILRPKDPIRITLSAIDRSLTNAGLPFATKPSFAMVANRRDALNAVRDQPEPGVLLVEIVQTLQPELGRIMLNAEVGLYHRELWREQHPGRAVRPKHGMAEGWLGEPVYRQTFVVTSDPVETPAQADYRARMAQVDAELEAALAQASSPRARQLLRDQHERKRAKIRKPAVSDAALAALSWATWATADNGALVDSYVQVESTFANALATDLTFDPP